MLPARLNKDALSDLVILQDGSGPLLTLETAPERIFTVDRDGSEDDASIVDDICDVDLGTPEHECTLRAAITQANLSAGLDEIRFSVGKLTKGPISAITDPVTIDGTPFGEPVQIEGHELFLSGGDSLVRGLGIYDSPGSAVSLEGGFLETGNNRIEGCLLGVSLPGVAGSTVRILSSSDNVVGGSQSEARKHPIRFPGQGWRANLERGRK